MNAATYTHVRANLAETMQQVCDDHLPIAITRHAKPAVVMLSLEDYQSLSEPAGLRRSPTHASCLLAADSHHAGEGASR